MSDEWAFREHQNRACSRASRVTGFAIAHDMGTGKSLTTIKYIYDNNCRLVLISCPKSVMSVWPGEFAKFNNKFPSMHVDHKIIVLNKGTIDDKVNFLITELTKAQREKKPAVVIINYDSIWRAPLGMLMDKRKVVSLGVLDSVKWDLHVMDEVHRIKDPGSKASIYCYHVNKAIRRRLGLSGTIMPHSPMDLYGVFRAIDVSILRMTFQQFKAKYANYKKVAVKGQNESVREFDKFLGMKNLEELHSKLADYIDIVRSEDVLDLPEQIHEKIFVELNPKATKAYRELYSKFHTEVEEGKLTVSTAMVKMLRLNQITGGAMPLDDGGVMVIDTSKVDALEDILEDIPIDEPVIVFSRFKHECAAIRKVFEKQKRRHGELSGSCNDLADFMACKIDAMSVQIRSGGVGVDFTRARYCFYINTGLSLGDYQQSIKRAHRDGQTRSVFYYHIIAQGTVDEAIYEALSNKKDVVDAVMDGIQKESMKLSA